MNVLPHKPSELIRIAVADAKKVEGDVEHYQLSMDTWHEYLPRDKVCCVCLAGAVMAKTLEVEQHEVWTPTHFTLHNEVALLMINSIRTGTYTSLVGHLEQTTLASNLDVVKFDEIEVIMDYIKVNRKYFPGEGTRADWEVYLNAADKFEKIGL